MARVILIGGPHAGRVLAFDGDPNNLPTRIRIPVRPKIFDTRSTSPLEVEYTLGKLVSAGKEHYIGYIDDSDVIETLLNSYVSHHAKASR